MQNTPHIFDYIQIRAIWRPVKNPYPLIIKFFFADFTCMSWGIVLLKNPGSFMSGSTKESPSLWQQPSLQHMLVFHATHPLSFCLCSHASIMTISSCSCDHYQISFTKPWNPSIDMHLLSMLWFSQYRYAITLYPYFTGSIRVRILIHKVAAISENNFFPAHLLIGCCKLQSLFLLLPGYYWLSYPSFVS